MGIPLEQLPLHVRKKIAEQHAARPVKSRQQSRASESPSPEVSDEEHVACKTCGQEFLAYAKAERHVDSDHNGMGVITCLLVSESKP